MSDSRQPTIEERLAAITRSIEESNEAYRQRQEGFDRRQEAFDRRMQELQTLAVESAERISQLEHATEMQYKTVVQVGLQVEAIGRQVQSTNESVRMLAHVADQHERRLRDLEGGGGTPVA